MNQNPNENKNRILFIRQRIYETFYSYFYFKKQSETH